MDDGDGIKRFIGPDGQVHFALKNGSLTFSDGVLYSTLGNVTFGNNGDHYIKMGNALINPNGKTHWMFGDSPTFII